MDLTAFAKTVNAAALQKLGERSQWCRNCWVSCAMWLSASKPPAQREQDWLRQRELKWRLELDTIRIAAERAPWGTAQQDVLRRAFVRCFMTIHRQAVKYRQPDGQINCTQTQMSLAANEPVEYFYREWNALWE